MIKLFDILKLVKEDIDPEEATSDTGAIQTVLDGKRNMGVVSLTSNTLRMYDEREFYDFMENNGLKVLRIPKNPYKNVIFYRPEAESEAKELRDIAKKYDGYFAWYAEDDDTRRIGELLGYQKDKVEAFVQKNSERAAQKRKEIAASKSKK